MNTPNPLYLAAETRVESDSDLIPYRDTILYEWPEGDEHWQWVIDTPAAVIIAWAQATETPAAAE